MIDGKKNRKSLGMAKSALDQDSTLNAKVLPILLTTSVIRRLTKALTFGTKQIGKFYAAAATLPKATKKDLY